MIQHVDIDRCHPVAGDPYQPFAIPEPSIHITSWKQVGTKRVIRERLAATKEFRNISDSPVSPPLACHLYYCPECYAVAVRRAGGRGEEPRVERMHHRRPSTLLQATSAEKDRRSPRQGRRMPARSRFALIIGTALLTAAGVLAGVLFVTGSVGTLTSRSASSTSSVPLLGSSVTASDVAETTTQFGTLPIVRVYYPGLPGVQRVERRPGGSEPLCGHRQLQGAADGHPVRHRRRGANAFLRRRADRPPDLLLLLSRARGQYRGRPVHPG